MIDRVILIVLDGFGVGELPDAKKYGDVGSNTLKGIRNSAKLNIPMEKANLKGILCNEVGSGTEILKQYGEEHIKTGYPIIYTSADSVIQIAAHEDIIAVPELYQICEIIRKIVDKPKYNIGTVIARPFIGKNAETFKRTYNRKDFEANTFGTTMLDIISKEYNDAQVIHKVMQMELKKQSIA